MKEVQKPWTDEKAILIMQCKTIIWRRKWQCTPVFLPGESHGQRSLAGYRLWGRKSRTRPSDQAQHTKLWWDTITHYTLPIHTLTRASLVRMVHCWWDANWGTTTLKNWFYPLLNFTCRCGYVLWSLHKYVMHNNKNSNFKGKKK